MIVEFWVMRVLLHPGPRGVPVRLEHMTPTSQVATLALVAAGDLCCMPDGCICEPVEVFEHELDAQEHRAKLVRDNPGTDYRVALNTDVTV